METLERLDVEWATPKIFATGLSAADIPLCQMMITMHHASLFLLTAAFTSTSYSMMVIQVVR